MNNLPPPPTPFNSNNNSKLPPPPGGFAPMNKFPAPAPGVKNNNNNNNNGNSSNRFPMPSPAAATPTTKMMNNNNNNNNNNNQPSSSSFSSGPMKQQPFVPSPAPAPAPAPVSAPVGGGFNNNNNKFLLPPSNSSTPPAPFNNSGSGSKQPMPTMMMTNNNNSKFPPPPPGVVGGGSSATSSQKSSSMPSPVVSKMPLPAPTMATTTATTSTSMMMKSTVPVGAGGKFPPPPVGGGKKFPPPPGSNNNVNNNNNNMMNTTAATSNSRPGPSLPPPPAAKSSFPPPPTTSGNNNINNNIQAQPHNVFPTPNSANQNQMTMNRNSNNSINTNNNNFPPPPPNSKNNVNTLPQQQPPNFNNTNIASNNTRSSSTPIQQQQQQPPQMQMQQGENAHSHTLILEKSTSKNTRLLRHATIPRTSNITGPASGSGNTVSSPSDLRSIVPLSLSSSHQQQQNTNTNNYHSRFNSRSVRPLELQSMQCTTKVMPASPTMAEKFGVPIGISCRPLAPIYRGDCLPEEESTCKHNRNSKLAPPIVHFQEIDNSISMIRCSQCRSYINPFVSFTSPDRYICCVCRRSNSVPIAYQCEVDRQTGMRTDIQQRHELRHACCDIVAPQEYVQGAPKRPTMLFMIDVSYQAVTSGFLEKVCEGLLNGIVEQQALTDDYQIAFLAYDSNIYLFNLSPELDSPKMIAAPDLVFDQMTFNERGEIGSALELPCLLEDLFCQPQDSAELIRQLLTKLPIMFNQTNAAESAYGPALNTAMSILAGPGGKVFSYIGSCPGSGEGKLDATMTTKRGAPVSSTESPPANTLPANGFYKVRAHACSSHQISVDLIVSGATEVDLATIAPIARYTSGHITRVHSAFDLRALPDNIAACLGREYGFDAVLRIRAPSSVSLKNFYGHFHVKGPDLLALPVCDSDSVYSFELAPTNNINYSPVFVQVALMFTTRNRERRIRVMTFGMETSADLAKLFNNCSAPLCASFYGKMLVDQCITSSFQKGIQSIVESLGKSLKTFRNVIHGMSRTNNQLSLPYSLQALPLLLAGIFRSAAVRPLSFAGNNPNSPAALASPELKSNDERVTAGSMLVFSTIDYFLSCCMPTCWCVWDPSSAVLDPANSDRVAVDEMTGEPVLPRSELCSVESLRSDSIFIIECGEKLFCWIGKNVPAEVLSSFGLYNASSVIFMHTSRQQGDAPATTMFPEASACARACCELIANRQSLVADNQAGTSWGSVIVLFQDPQNKLMINNRTSQADVPEPDTSIAFNNLGLNNTGVERSMYPFLVEDEMQDAVSYGTLLMSLAKKAAEQ